MVTDDELRAANKALHAAEEALKQAQRNRMNLALLALTERKQADVARVLGIPRSNVNRWLREHR